MCLFDGFGVTRQQSLNLQFLVAVDQQHTVDKRHQWGVDQQRHNNELIGTNCQFGLAPCFVADEGVQDGLEIAPFPMRRKYQSTHGGPVKPANIINNVVSESSSNRRKCGLAGFNELTCDDVGIDNRDAALRKQFRNGRLSACDSASKAYS